MLVCNDQAEGVSSLAVRCYIRYVFLLWTVRKVMQLVCVTGRHVTKGKHHERVRTEYLLAYEQFPKWNAQLPLAKVTFALTLNPELLYVCAAVLHWHFSQMVHAEGA